MSELPRSFLLSPTDHLMRALACGRRGEGRCHALVYGPSRALHARLEARPARELLRWLSSLELSPDGRAWRIANDVPPWRDAAFTGKWDELVPESVHEEDAPFVLSRLTSEDAGYGILVSWDHALFDAHAAELLLKAVLFGDAGIELGIDASRDFPVRGSRPGAMRGLEASREIACYLAEKAARGRDHVPAAADSMFARHAFALRGGDALRLHEAFERHGLTVFPSAALIAASGLATARALGRDLGLMVGVPHDARRPGRQKRMFPAELTMLFFAVECRAGGSLGSAVSDVVRQFMQIVERGMHRRFREFMELGACLSPRVYESMVHGVHPGGPCSMYVSCAGDSTLGMLEGDSAPLRLVHYPPHFRDPGLSIVFWWCNGALNVSVVASDAVRRESGLARFEACIREVLGNEW